MKLTNMQSLYLGYGLIILGGLIGSAGFGLIWGVGAFMVAAGVYTALCGYALLPESI